MFPRVYLAILTVFHVGALPTRSLSEESAESLLAQIHSLEQSTAPDSEVVANLKDTLNQNIDRIRFLDNTDRATLSSQTEVAEATLATAQQQVAEANAALVNTTAHLTQLQQQCDGRSAALDAVKSVYDTIHSRVVAQDEIAARENLQFTKAVAAIQRDLQILDVIENKLDNVVTSAAAKAAIAPAALQHQVGLLVSDMRKQLGESAANSHTEWQLTQQRLAMESEPIRNRQLLAQANVTAAMSALGVCQNSLAGVERDLKAKSDHLEVLRKAVAQAQDAVANIQTEFAKRHDARLKRLAFLADTLQQLTNLSEKASQSSKSSNQ